MRGGDAQTAILNVRHASWLVQHRMEQIVAVELCPVPAGITGAERLTARPYGKGPLDGWGARGARCAIPIPHRFPIIATSTEDTHFMRAAIN